MNVRVKIISYPDLNEGQLTSHDQMKSQKNNLNEFDGAHNFTSQPERPTSDERM